MKDLSTHTRLTPEQRENRLNRSINNMSRNASVQTTLSTWGLSFENKLLYLTGRVLPAERILQGARAPKLTVLVVKKRSSSRFFILLDPRLSNPPPGTVIDAEVT
ncbi:hypothetical protein AMELA_G00037590 [Ameiurus melas]|uniref:Uncharacterized protein n=1 Tax=Ameiurus melas TaxID=219545 RepID=A0A7J6B8U6_AMEME|nr:hypothetical protein AMELA_G00037590 [Ameiurus melas]